MRTDHATTMSVRRNIKMLQCNESKVWLAAWRWFDGRARGHLRLSKAPSPLLY